MTLVSLILAVWAVLLLGWWFTRRRTPSGISKGHKAVAVRREWMLYRPDGSVPLGLSTESEALLMAAKMGARVTFVDQEFALIFADTHLAIERHENGEF